MKSPAVSVKNGKSIWIEKPPLNEEEETAANWEKPSTTGIEKEKKIFINDYILAKVHYNLQ